MTVFGVENTKGDVIAIVTVNNGEGSRVKFLETEGAADSALLQINEAEETLLVSRNSTTDGTAYN
jgi:hypothetical protein